jgi:type IVB pilus formation R64 PilN family outer membrane protein
MMRLKSIAALSAMTLMSACTGLPGKIDHGYGETQAKTDRMARDIGQVQATSKAAAPVVHESGMWIARSTTRIAPQDNLPPVFYEPTTFDRSVGSLTEFAERVTLRSGIPTKVSPDAAGAAQRVFMPAFGAASPQVGTPTTPPQGATLPPPSATAGFGPYTSLPGAQGTRPEVRITYLGGNLKGLLDTAAARFGVYWKYDPGKVTFYYTDTRTFQISAIPGDSSMSTTVASGSTSGSAVGSAGAATGGGSANNSQNTAMTTQLSVFSSMEKAITAMLSTYGKVVSSPATGSITVSDTPDILDRVAQYIDTENQSLSRQVMVNVTVLSVNTADLDNYGINWNLVYSTLANQYGVQNSFAAENGSTSFSAAVLNTAATRLAGSSVMINALSSQGKVRRETSASVVTLNNQPVPVQVARQTSFLQSSQTAITANVGSSTSLTPGTVTSGFNMSILPHVLSNGTVMLQFSTDISALRGIRTVTSNGSSIETPEIDTRNFLQRVAMKSGETLVISGFEQIEDSMDGQGVGKPSNFVFGGGYKANSAKESIVILITPVMVGGA